MENDSDQPMVQDSSQDQVPPSSPEFHGFGPEDVPGKLVLETAVEDGVEYVVRVGKQDPTSLPDLLARTSTSSSTTPKSKSKALSSAGTQSRPKVYLLEKLDNSLGFAKLPKAKAVLRVFLHQLRNTDGGEQAAAGETVVKVKEVWQHHFGSRVIMGFDTAMQEETKKMVAEDRNIVRNILKIWKEWRELERTSRREDRCHTPGFKRKEEKFEREVLDMPFSILVRDYESILKDSGIKDWKEDLVHLHNQLQREQVGSCAAKDFRQKKRDDRKVYEKLLEEAKIREINVATPGQASGEDEDVEVMDVGDEDDDFCVKARRQSTHKVDVMGPITATADRLGLSVRQRCVMAAAVANTLEVDIDKTNISKTSAWSRSQQERVKIAKCVKDGFQKPERVVVHFDGKILKIKGNMVSNRVAVYITGVEESPVRKLLGVPETKDGTGVAEAEVVKEQLLEWDVKEEVCGIVFDTTSSNTGADAGACTQLEQWLERPVLWLACRHHVHELHVKWMIQEMTGQTKDPGVALFRRLKSEWYKLDIDYTKLRKLELGSAPEWVQEEAMAVLAWAEEELAKNTWPRADYQELLVLTIISLGGEVEGFKFMLPGPDHHARWMSKMIYYLKINLLQDVFDMTAAEKIQVQEISKFILIFCVKAWLESPLPTSAARNDLTYMLKVMRYRGETKPRVTMAVMQSWYRHLWYLAPQTVVLALADPGLEDGQKEGMARKLHGLERVEISGGKPVFPQVDLSGEHGLIPDMASFVTSDSWLIFDIIGLTGAQDWLSIPASLWENYLEFRIFKEFCENVSVCNDIAERGVALITSYINKAESEEQRQAMLQVVEFHRALVTTTNKSSLKLC